MLIFYLKLLNYKGARNKKDMKERTTRLLSPMTSRKRIFVLNLRLNYDLIAKMSIRVQVAYF